MPADGGSPARDLTPEADYDIPPDERSGPGDINFSPDGKEICYTAVTDKVEAISTNADLFVVPVSGGDAKRITSNPGSMAIRVFAGWTLDRLPCAIDRGIRGRPVARHAVRPPDGQEHGSHSRIRPQRQRFGVVAGQQNHLLHAENETLQPIYAMEARAGAAPKKLLDGYNGAFSFNGDATVLVTERTSLTSPSELFVAAGEGSGLKQLTHQNDAILAQLEMMRRRASGLKGRGDESGGDGGAAPGFFAREEISNAGAVHGGPQTMWDDAWATGGTRKSFRLRATSR